MNKASKYVFLLICFAGLLCSCVRHEQFPSSDEEDFMPHQPSQPLAGDREEPGVPAPDSKVPALDDTPGKNIEPAAPENSRKLSAYEYRILSLLYPRNVLTAANICVGPAENLPEDSLWPLIVTIALQNDCAITVGANIYFPIEPDTSTAWGLEWLAHEIRHVQQYQQAGGTDNFLTAYARYVLIGSLSSQPLDAYTNNPFENDARVYQQCFVRLLRARPELAEALQMDRPARDMLIDHLTKKNTVQYRSIIGSSLSTAKKSPTIFKISQDRSFTIDFHLRGQYTKPVGTTIDLTPKPANSAN